MDAVAGRDWSKTALQMLTASEERRVVGGGKVELHHREQRGRVALGLAEGEMVDGVPRIQ
jgi:hypothetical protein